MKNSRHLKTGSRVALSIDVSTDGGHFWSKGTPAVVDAIWRKKGEERIYLRIDNAIVLLDKHGMEDDRT